MPAREMADSSGRFAGWYRARGWPVAARKATTHEARQEQGFALHPPKAEGLWNPITFQIDEVQGLGPSREGARRTRRVWAEPRLS